MPALAPSAVSGPEPPLVAGAPWAQTARWTVRPVGYLEEARRRHGERFRALFLPLERGLVLLGNPGDVRDLFRGPPEVMHSATARSPLALLVGEHSVLTLNGRPHMRQRKLLLPPFHGDRMLAYGELIDDIAHREIDSWAAGTEMAAAPSMQRITLEVILHAVFGVAAGTSQDRLTRQITDLLALTGGAAGMVRIFVTARRGRRPARLTAAMERLDASLYAEIARRRAAEDLDDREDILSMLLAARDEAGQAMTDTELRDELITLLLAGHETTATTLAWALERLVRHPAALARLREGVAAGEPAYVDAVIHETLRDRPVIPLAVRELQAPAQIGDMELRAGSFVGPAIWLVNHRPETYEQPYAFRPERFVGEAPDTYAWVPFGGGHRRCLGAAFAQFEMRGVLRAVASRCTLSAPGPDAESVRRRNVTFTPARGGVVRVDAVTKRRAAAPLAATA